MDWIKMRRGLIDDPKLIAMSEFLAEEDAFRRWIVPGTPPNWTGPGDGDGEIVTRDALRNVTLALLCHVWCAAREHGTVSGDDCFLPWVSVDGLDSMARAPRVGAAMERVGWARASSDPPGVILPKFFLDYNMPVDREAAAERQRRYRERLKGASAAPSLDHNALCVTRDAKVTQRRVDERRDDDDDDLLPSLGREPPPRRSPRKAVVGVGRCAVKEGRKEDRKEDRKETATPAPPPTPAAAPQSDPEASKVSEVEADPPRTVATPPARPPTPPAEEALPPDGRLLAEEVALTLGLGWQKAARIVARGLDRFSWAAWKTYAATASVKLAVLNIQRYGLPSEIPGSRPEEDKRTQALAKATKELLAKRKAEGPGAPPEVAAELAKKYRTLRRRPVRGAVGGGGA